MGENIKDFKSWNRLNEGASFLGFIGNLFTGAEPTSTEPSKETEDKKGEPEKEKASRPSGEKVSKLAFKDPGKKIPAENVSELELAMDRHGITNIHSRKAILAVVSKEGPELQPERDYSNTSNERIREVFGERVKDLSDSQLTSLKNNPTKFWDRVYGVDDPTGKGKKYGNTNPGDGELYRGRGFNQITFKSNYKKLQEVYNKIGKLGKSVNIVENPTILDTDAEVAAEFAILYFINRFESKNKDLNGYSDLRSAVEDYVHANSGWGSNIHAGVKGKGLEKALEYAQSIA